MQTDKTMTEKSEDIRSGDCARAYIDNVWMLLPDRKIAFGGIAFEKGRIAAIDIKSDSTRPPLSGDAVRVVLPGLVNCHGHTTMTLLRGLGSGLPLQRWLEEAIFPVEAKMKPGDIYAGAKWGAMEMLAGGTTTVADMYDFPEEGERAFADAGMRAHTCRVGLSFVPGRLEDCIKYTAAGSSDLPSVITRDLSIHSEYLTDENFCRALAEANLILKRPLHFHCSETEKEHAECLQRHGKTPIQYLADTGLLDHGGYAAHCVYCTDDDFKVMAEKGVSLVHNPSSNMKLGSGFARILRARELGVNVALGTDGCASNDNLDMFEEMHLASLIHKGQSRDPGALSAWDVIEMATVNGAKALGRGDIGSLEVGKAADFALVELSGYHLNPVLDLANLIVHSMHASDVAETYVGGRKVYDRTWPIDGELMALFKTSVNNLLSETVKPGSN